MTTNSVLPHITNVYDAVICLSYVIGLCAILWMMFHFFIQFMKRIPSFTDNDKFENDSTTSPTWETQTYSTWVEDRAQKIQAATPMKKDIKHRCHDKRCPASNQHSCHDLVCHTSKRSFCGGKCHLEGCNCNERCHDHDCDKVMVK